MGQHQTSKQKYIPKTKDKTTHRKQMAALVSKSFHTRPGTRTQNLKIRSLARYPITPAGPVEPLQSFINMILQHQGDWFRIHPYGNRSYIDTEQVSIFVSVCIVETTSVLQNESKYTAFTSTGEDALHLICTWIVFGCLDRIVCRGINTLFSK